MGSDLASTVDVQRVQAFDGGHSAIVTTGIIYVHRKSHPWMMRPKSQFLLGERRDNLRDKIILSE
jgi:hypothetical protein